MSIYTISSDDLLLRLRASLAEDEELALDAALRAAKELRFSLYLVGGSVRDLILLRRTIDLDLVTEGAPAQLAERIAELTGGQVKVYGRFATTCVTLGRVRVDVARARLESYRRPGALPDVVPGPLHDDLARRDFTVNAMALGLAGQHEGELIDPEGGLADLQARRVRVIHAGSFVDDATRILRGLRLASRLWFDLEPETRRLMEVQAEYLQTISGSRLRTELHFLLADLRPWRSLQEGFDLGVLNALVTGLAWDERRSRLARAYVQLGAAERAARLLVLLASTLGEEGAARMVQRFSLGVREGRLVTQAPLFVSAVEEAGRRTSVELALRVSGLESAVVGALSELMLPPEEAERLVGLTRTRPRLRGDDVIALGLREGPAVGAVLEELRRAAMAGAVTTKDDELALARKLIEAKRGRERH